MAGSNDAGMTPDAERRRRFEAFASDVYEPLQRYVHRRIDAIAADDVVSDTLLVCWRRLDDIPADAPLAWTLGVARRCLANDRRGRRRQANVGHRLAAQPTPSSALSNSPGSPESSIAEIDLRRALAELAETDREIVLLWAWDGLEPREIATALGLTANAVSIRLHRVKQRLAVRLEVGRDAGFLELRRKIHGGSGHLTGGRIDEQGQEDR